MKTIAISKSLVNLKDELEALGYLVLYEDQVDSPVDVYIYSRDADQGSLYSATQFLGNTFLSQANIDPRPRGTLLINGMDKTLEDIMYILKNRVYSPIFP